MVHTDTTKQRSKDPVRSTRPAPPARKRADNTIMFFDWDDTILASTVLCTNGINLSTPVVPEEIVKQFEPLQDQILKVFDIAFQYTNFIFVITNAEKGWVELSAQKFMPRVAAQVSRFNVVSARSTYQDAYPNRPDMWKKTAFIERISACFPRESEKYIGPKNVNVISFGDSECERTALMSITDLCADTASLKSIKLVERPTTEQLKRQLEMIMNNFNFIVRHEGSLDLMLQISTLQASTPNPQGAAQNTQTTPSANSSASTAAAATSSAAGNRNNFAAPAASHSPPGEYNSPDGRVPEEMRREFEERQRLEQQRAEAQRRDAARAVGQRRAVHSTEASAPVRSGASAGSGSAARNPPPAPASRDGKGYHT